MKKKSFLCLILATVLTTAAVFSGCGKSKTADSTETSKSEASASKETVSASVSDTEGDLNIESDNNYEKPDTDRYIKLSLNVYFNDSTHSYFSNEPGSEAIYVTAEGRYALTFDCDKDLSDTAKAAGVSELKNLTAVYITDMEYLAGTGKSPLRSCNIFYDEVYVNNEKLTVTLDKPKAAFKSNGVFDTNDPVNSWDGSYVAEVESAEHVANFATVSSPKKITVVFTLSDFVWEDADTDDTAKEAEKADNKTVELTGNNKAVFSNMDLTGMDALTLSYYMGNGINLGNTFEAVSTGKNGSVATYESAWGQPKTTKDMIAGYKNAGFDTLRIPVAWTNTMDYLNGDFEINADYMERVAEVVDWALENEQFVVLNDHWDSGWWAMFGSKTPDTVNLAWKVYEEMWKQVAGYFKDYPDMLIFESANEELGNGLNNN
ncbi:MAG: cellulase family glycosylhydrolase, partial [Lachnospiraceae bacterium]|nr:cellulase family glycosylhydrolase [Lachnospiraceae bacterium]